MRSLPALLLLATVLIPPSAYIALRTSSMSAGVLAVAASFGLLFAASGAVFWPTRRIFTCIVGSICALLAISVLGAISFAIHPQFDLPRFLMSLFLLVAITAGAFSFARLADEVKAETADKAIRVVFYVLLLFGIANALGQSWLFAEKSHYALSFLPFLLYMTVTARRKLAYLLAGVGVALALQSMTLVVGVALIGFLSLRKRHLLLIGVLASLAIWAAADEENTAYYVERLTLSADSSNLSALAYLQGWERAYLNLMETNGLGVGFQQFGIVGSEGDIQHDIKAIVGAELNTLDGSTVGSKIVGEFGTLGILLLLAYIAYAFRLTNLQSSDRKEVFFACCLLMYSIDLFVRGTGYFSPSGFLVLAALYWFTLRSQPHHANSSHH